MTDRRWLELRVRSRAAGDLDALLADVLVGLGARGVEERDGWFVAHYPEPADPEAFVERAREALADEARIDDLVVEHAWQAHEEWAESWKRGLEPRRITDRIVVRPSWMDAETRPGDVVIVLDPGMAFGTAEHGTTRGCLRLLDGIVEPGQSILDVGAGSGILAIAAALLGAVRVVAIEGDDLACEAMAENVERNHVADRVSVEHRWADPEDLTRRGPVDGIVANIETGLLEPLHSGFAGALAPGGWLVVSGILAEEWTRVRDALTARGFRYEALDADDEWRSGLFRFTPPDRR